MKYIIIFLTCLTFIDWSTLADHDDDFKVSSSLSELAIASENLTKTLGTENVLSEIQSTISLPEIDTSDIIISDSAATLNTDVLPDNFHEISHGGETLSEDGSLSHAISDLNAPITTFADAEFTTTETPLIITTPPVVLESLINENSHILSSENAETQNLRADVVPAIIEPVVNEIVGTETSDSLQATVVDEVVVTEEPVNATEEQIITTTEESTSTTTEEPTTTTPEGPTTTTLPYIAPSTTEEALLNAGSYSDIYFDINSMRAKVVAWKGFQEDINGRISSGNWWIPLKVLSGAAHVVNGVQYEMKVVGGQSNCTQEMNIWDVMPERCSYAEAGRRAIFNIITYEKNSRWTDYSPIFSRSFSIFIREVYPGEDLEQLS